MTPSHAVSIYDLTLTTGCTISPFVWRTKYALKHKGLELDVIPGGFVSIMARTGGRSERVPVIVDRGTWVLDSWNIAEYLDEMYPERPALFEGPNMKTLTKFLDTWLWRTVGTPWLECYILDYHDLSLPEDRAYVRKSRESFLGGRRLEAIQAGREDRLPSISQALEPFRELLREGPWLGGATPNFSDYTALAVFLWLASVAKTPPLAADDPLRDWVDRGFDLYGGLGREPGMHPIFGLERRAQDPELFSPAGRRVELVPQNKGPGSNPATRLDSSYTPIPTDPK